MTTRLIFGIIAICALAIAVPAAAFEINNAVSSETCILWTFTQHGQDGYTNLYLDGRASTNLTGSTEDRGYVVLCNFPPNTCHRLEGRNETDEDGVWVGNTTCTTGLDYDDKSIGWFVFGVWAVFFILTNIYYDALFATFTFLISGIAYRDTLLTSSYLTVAGTDANIGLAFIMVVLSVYMLYATWSGVIMKWRQNRAVVREEQIQRGEIEDDDD